MAGQVPLVILDSNIWVAERLLQTSMGDALLYAFTGDGMYIGLPEVVELEVDRVLAAHATSAIEQMRKDVRLLQQLSGQRMAVTAPSATAISEGLAARWKGLEGLLVRIPFTHQHAHSALHRIISKTPPCGENNEQFRDCCIWEAAVEMASDRIVYLISNDSAFYEARDRSRGLAKSLAAELGATGREVRLFPSLKDFLAAARGSMPELDQKRIATAITEAIFSTAENLALPEYVIGEGERPRISGYATPVPSVVAISFSVRFSIKKAESETREHDGTLRFDGVCSYNPKTGEVSDIEVRGSSKSFLDGGSGTTRFAKGQLDSLFREGMFEVIQ